MREACRLVLWSQQIAGDVARNGGDAAQRRLPHVTGWEEKKPRPRKHEETKVRGLKGVGERCDGTP